MRPIAQSNESNNMKLLDGTNYGSWRVQMEALLQALGLFKFITPRVETLKQLYVDDVEKLELLLENDEKALGYIKRNVELLHLDLLSDCKSAYDAWGRLESFFAGKEHFNKINLLQSLIDGSLRDTGNPLRDIQEFIQEKNELVQRLNSIGIKIDEDLQVAIMLARLPASFDTMRRILESQESLSLLKMTSELHREGIRRSEQRGPKRFTEHTALFSSFDSQIPNNKKMKFGKSKLYCDFCEVSGHDGERCWLNPSSKNYRKNFADSLKNKLNIQNDK